MKENNLKELIAVKTQSVELTEFINPKGEVEVHAFYAGAYWWIMTKLAMAHWVEGDELLWN